MVLKNLSLEIPKNFHKFCRHFLRFFCRIGNKKFPGIGYKKFLGQSYENFLGMGYKKYLEPGSSEWVTRNSSEQLSTFSQDFSVKDFPGNFRGFPGIIPRNFRRFSAKLLLGYWLKSKAIKKLRCLDNRSTVGLMCTLGNNLQCKDKLKHLRRGLLNKL